MSIECADDRIEERFVEIRRIGKLFLAVGGRLGLVESATPDGVLAAVDAILVVDCTIAIVDVDSPWTLLFLGIWLGVKLE